MDFDVLSDLNWLAVIVAAVAFFILGGAWFIPKVFGDIWTKAIGWEPADEDRGSSAIYILPLLGGLVMSIAIGLLAKSTGSDTFGEGLVLGLVVAIGVAAAIVFITAVFSPKTPKPWTWFAVMAGYYGLGTIIIAVVLSTWT